MKHTSTKDGWESLPKKFVFFILYNIYKDNC